MEKKFIIRVLKTQNLIGIGQIVLNQALFYNRTEVYVELITILMTDITRKQIFPGFKKLNDKIKISVRAKISYDAPLSLEDGPKLFSKSMVLLGPKGDAATKKISVNSHSVVNKTSQDTEILRFIENLKEKAFNSVTVNHPFLDFKMKNVENALKVFIKPTFSGWRAEARQHSQGPTRQQA